ncbi:hypothetical protein CXB51_028764 [Gossypium anomalum]|uniref:HAT C-terminal dimerisation domain-containing protein n=1 Tax=Gossypium anomalum TaxID=47600 RepID=A0A8J5YHH7_9ROSI|nr:hypothetical protein CXB51_028764 [Gossypium anomalum]
MATSNTPIHVDDGFNEYESAIKRHKSTTSKVWDEMTKLECDDKNKLKAQSAKDILMYYAKERDHVKEELAKAPGLICLTSDNWNSEHTNDEYICITAHWIDKDWKLQKRIIRFRALFPPYDGLNILDELVLCLSQWGIDKKIFSITLDNASYNIVLISCLKNRFHVNQAILCDGAFFQVRCCAHILNLIVKAGLELADDVVDHRYKLNYVQYCFTTIYGIHALDFIETILSKLRLLLDEYSKKSKSTSSSLAENSNVSDEDPVDSSLYQHNVNSVDFGGDFDESDDNKQYLNESNTKSEKSQLDIYLEEPELELKSQIDVLDYWSKSSIRYSELSLLVHDLLAIPISTVAFESAFSMGKKVITPLRSSLKPKIVQAVVCLDDWMRAKGFSMKIGDKNDDDDEDDVSSIAF